MYFYATYSNRINCPAFCAPLPTSFIESKIIFLFENEENYSYSEDDILCIQHRCTVHANFFILINRSLFIIFCNNTKMWGILKHMFVLFSNIHNVVFKLRFSNSMFSTQQVFN